MEQSTIISCILAPLTTLKANIMTTNQWAAHHPVVTSLDQLIDTILKELQAHPMRTSNLQQDDLERLISHHPLAHLCRRLCAHLQNETQGLYNAQGQILALSANEARTRSQQLIKQLCPTPINQRLKNKITTLITYSFVFSLSALALVLDGGLSLTYLGCSASASLAASCVTNGRQWQLHLHAFLQASGALCDAAYSGPLPLAAARPPL